MPTFKPREPEYESLNSVLTNTRPSKKERIDFYKISKFDVNCVNIDQDTAIQTLQNLLRNVRFLVFFVFKWLYLDQY